MQIIYGIVVFLIASSFIMVLFVWLMNLNIKQSEYSEISEENDYFFEQTQFPQNTQLSQNTLAA